MKVLIVSGFLGAGKTTFIRTLSNRLNKDFVILENEYASINIDKDIIKDDTGLNVWEFTEKCICCSGKADFAMNILTIANTISPEYLIVEPTGVGFLSNVILASRITCAYFALRFLFWKRRRPSTYCTGLGCTFFCRLSSRDK